MISLRAMSCRRTRPCSKSRVICQVVTGGVRHDDGKGSSLANYPDSIEPAWRFRLPH